jgi:hypothetical protein
MTSASSVAHGPHLNREARRRSGRHGVGDQQSADRQPAQPVSRIPHQQPVRGGHDNVGGGPAREEDTDGGLDGAAGADHVVDDHCGTALDIADDLLGVHGRTVTITRTHGDIQ